MPKIVFVGVRDRLILPCQMADFVRTRQLLFIPVHAGILDNVGQKRGFHRGTPYP
jgi:hypothetical protein